MYAAFILSGLSRADAVKGTAPLTRKFAQMEISQMEESESRPPETSPTDDADASLQISVNRA